MKKRMVLRLLSCCLAGILLLETPIQAAAAPSDTSAAGEISDAGDPDEGISPASEQSGSAEETGEQKAAGNPKAQETVTDENSDGAELPDGAKTQKDEEAETDGTSQPEGEAGTKDASQPEDGTGAEDASQPDDGTGTGNASQPDAETNAEEDSSKEENESKSEGPETGTESEPEEPIQTEDPEREEKSDNLILTGLQYGVLPEYSDDFDADASADVLSALADAFTAGEGEAQIGEYALSPDMLRDMLTWLASNEEGYDTLLPYVTYTYVDKEDGQEVQTVSVSWLSPERQLSISPVYHEQDVRISFAGAEGIEQYKLYQISEDEIREFPAEEGQDVVIDRTESEDPAAYQYVVCGYRTEEEELKLFAFSKCMYAEYEPAPITDLVTEPAQGTEALKPGTPTLTYTISKNNATLRWKAVEHADGYILYEYMDGQYVQRSRTDGSVSAEFTHNLLDMKFNESHKYAVSAFVNSSDTGQAYIEGEKSNIVEIQIGFEPIQLTASAASCKEVSLAWTQSYGADGYEIQRTGFADVIRIESGSTTAYRDTVLPNHTYTYQIRPYQINKRDTAGRPIEYSYGEWSGAASVEPALLAANGVSVNALDYKTLEITWQPVDGATGYRVYRSASKNGTYTNIAALTSAAETRYQDTGRQPGVTCYYKVRPYCVVNGETVEGNDSLAASGKTKMGTTTGVKAASTSYNSVQISWSKTAGASGYQIYYSTSKDSGYKALKTTSSTSYKHTGLTTGKTYYYKIRAYRTVNGKKSYGNYSKVAKAKVVPATVVAKKSATTYNSVKISWNKVSGASGYVIYRSESKNGTWKNIKTIGSSKTKSYTDKGLIPGKTYYYKIRAYRTVSGKKVYGAYSEVVSAKPQLKTPTLKKSTVTYDSATLKWNKISGASGYQIYRSTSPDGPYTRVKSISKASTLSYKDTKLSAGTTYYYKVRAYRTVSGKKGYSAYSKTISVLPTLDKVKDFKAAPTGNEEKGSIQLSWSKVPGAAGYAIERSATKNGTYKTIKAISSGDTLSYTNTNLTFGETYYYRISATKGDYRGPVSGSVSAAAIAVSLSDTSLTLSVGDTEKLAAATVPKTKISWSSSDNDVVKVDSNGKVTAVGGGTARIYVKVNGVETTKSVSVTVKGAIYGTYKGIDVSSYQGTIDWKKVADDGVDFALIRGVIGSSSSDTKDSMFEANYTGANANGIKTGVYRYSYATSRTKARTEAKAILAALNGRKLDYPIVMDVEDQSILSGTDSNARRSEIILAFKKEVEDAGYNFALYANSTWLNSYLDMDMLKDVDIWIARWRDLEQGHGYKGKGNVTMWQYTSSGRVNGISGNVDMNVSYKKY